MCQRGVFTPIYHLEQKENKLLCQIIRPHDNCYVKLYVPMTIPMTIAPKKFTLDMQITTHALKVTNSDGRLVFKDAQKFLQMQEKIYNFYSLDKLCTIYDVYNIESAVIGQKINYYVNDLPVIDQSDIIIKEKKDIYKIKNLDFSNNERSKFVLNFIDLYKEKYEENYKPRFCGPFSLAANLRGYGNLINDIYDDKKFVNEFFKVINNEILTPWIDLQRERTGTKDIICSGADAWVAVPNVNLDILNNFILPNYSDLKDLNGNIYFSILGGARFLKNPIEFLKIQKELNPFLVKGFDPDVEILGPDIFLEFANANNMDLLLGIDPNLLYDDLAKIFKRINSYINSGLKTKQRFTLYFNDVPQDIKPEKFSKIIKYIKNIRSDLS